MGMVICYGDSNTYGYNPETGGRYRACWVDMLSRRTGWDIKNMGVCGREIPVSEPALLQTPSDSILIMLGSNDLLDGYNAKEAEMKMERFLSSLSPEKIILIAPVKFQHGSWVPSERLVTESGKLQSVYADLARRMKVRFVNTAGWEVPLSFDGVHYTKEGHRIFSEKIKDAIAGLRAFPKGVRSL